NKIHILSEDKTSLVYPNLIEPLTQADYKKWGMDTLVDYENEIDKVLIEMNESEVLEDGRVLRKLINKNDFKINSLRVNMSPILQLIKSSNKIQVLSEGNWLDTGLVEPLTKEDFETHGMDDLSLISFDKWDELDDEFEIITWTEDMDSDKFIEITTDAFIPIEKISESNFEVLMWTDYMEPEEPPKIEITILPFRPIDKLDNQFSIVMGEYEPE
ncbi:MAG: hypothetical protein GX958_11460, partial [Desulfitobacterium sp.]|nr:hypothetical protein [Desulfitobacterium sp.]